MPEIQSALQGRFTGGVFAEDKKVGLRRDTQGPRPGPIGEGGMAQHPQCGAGEIAEPNARLQPSATPNSKGLFTVTAKRRRNPNVIEPYVLKLIGTNLLKNTPCIAFAFSSVQWEQAFSPQNPCREIKMKIFVSEEKKSTSYRN